MACGYLVQSRLFAFTCAADSEIGKMPKRTNSRFLKSLIQYKGKSIKFTQAV